MNDKYTIFIDADGVLADWNKKATEVVGAPPLSVSKSKLWSSIAKYDVEVEPFYENLEKLSGADELVKFITENFSNYYVLTATGFTPSNVGEQKTKWVERNFPIFKGKVKLVRKSYQKSKYATSNNILIDDQSKSIDPWVKAGGTGILYENTAKTIELLLI